MGVAASPGYPQNSGTLIPSLWSGKLLVKFYSATVLAAISNTDYEGEIKDVGDEVTIRGIPSITIRDYTKGQSLLLERPVTPITKLVIDKAKYWSFIVDDIDKFQSDIAFFDKWSTDAGHQLKIHWDTLALGTIFVDADPANRGATAGKKSGSINLGVSGTTALVIGNGTGEVSPVDVLIRIGQALDEQDVPEEGRWAVIPAWMSAKFKLSDLKNAYLTGDSVSPLRNGRIGDVNNTTIYVSNLLSTEVIGGNTCWRILGGHKSALTFASQIAKTESLRAESTFGEIARGLSVCGWKVVKPESLVLVIGRPGT